MITPRSPSASASVSSIAAEARRNMLKLPIRLTLITWLKLASACGPFLPRIFSPRSMPAQLTRPLRPPKALTVACTAASAATSLLISATTLCAPRRWACAATASAFMSTSITLAPAATSISAVAAPRPEAPPVTRKTLFSICMIVSLDSSWNVLRRGLLSLGDFLVAQDKALQFAAWGFRQLADKFDFAGIRVRRQALAHVLTQLFGQLRGCAVLRADHDEGLYQLGALRIGLSGHCGFHHRRGLDQCAFHIQRADAVAGGGDHVVATADEADAAVRVPLDR